jgi:hypothetical protein
VVRTPRDARPASLRLPHLTSGCGFSLLVNSMIGVYRILPLGSFSTTPSRSTIGLLGGLAQGRPVVPASITVTSAITMPLGSSTRANPSREFRRTDRKSTMRTPIMSDHPGCWLARPAGGALSLWGQWLPKNLNVPNARGFPPAGVVVHGRYGPPPCSPSRVMPRRGQR